MARRKKKTRSTLNNDPLWYKDAIIYQTHVRAFRDSNGDGVGDFRGLISKLDYLQDLGITALWLLPFYPSPLRDDGYDIADYTSIHDSYGSLRDFQEFLDEAHARGLRVITELVLNHTSDQHKWFQRARHASKNSRYRNYYVWNDKPDKYDEARIIFSDFESSNWTWDAQAQSYYWHRFYSHQPDLNFDNPAVRRELMKIVDNWCEMGVDGFRLDAIPYLYEREGTSCENLPETHQFLKDLRAHMQEKYEGRVFLAEANQWPEDAAAYFGDADECHMAFHFPLMPRLFMALRREDRFPIVEILEQTPQIPDGCQWALFLRNHDELTLEMVTDAERDFMYRSYASDTRSRINLGIRRRLAPLLENNRRKIELLNSLLFSLPGSPIIYYGDEIGMGDNVYLGDRNGVRTPMQWSSDRNAGFSQADPQSLYLPVTTGLQYHYSGINVETQQENSTSLLWWMKRIIALRKRLKVFGRGSLEFLNPQNPRIIAFLRQYKDETVLVVANLSRFVQYVELDMSDFEGWTPVELIGLTRFPKMGELPYFLTLGPHGFYWFLLEEPEKATRRADERGGDVPPVTVQEDWDELVSGDARESLERVLPDFLKARRWFGSKTRAIRHVSITADVPVRHDQKQAILTTVQVDYSEGDPETYLLPLACATGEDATVVERETSAPLIARVIWEGREEQGILYDALWDTDFPLALLRLIAEKRRLQRNGQKLVSGRSRRFSKLVNNVDDLEVVMPKVEQSNSSVLFRDGDGRNVLMMKLFRRLEQGTNPDLEVTRFLSQQTRFEQIPPYAGTVEYQGPRGREMTIGLCQGYVENEGDAWQYTLNHISDYLDVAVTRSEEIEQAALPASIVEEPAQLEIPELALELMGDYLELVRLLGKRTGEMHTALGSTEKDQNFAPERFVHFHRHALHHEITGKTRRALATLRRHQSSLPESAREDAKKLLESYSAIRTVLRPLRDRRISAKRMRTHSDYHLGQVLFTGKDFVIIDFEGEPAAPISERRIKRSPMRDVAGMLRSFHYASRSPLVDEVSSSSVRPQDRSLVEQAAEYWYQWTTRCFLEGYFSVVEDAGFLPKQRSDAEVLLSAFLLEKASYELVYEMNNRPLWAAIPVNGLLRLLQDKS